MGEKVFFSKGSVKVTDTRFIVSRQTFAMSGITSIKLDEDKPPRTIPFFFIITGVIGLFLGKTILPFGIAFIVLGAAWYALQRSHYHVLLHSASGETKAFSSKNKKWVKNVVTALNDSIIYRG